MLRVYFHIGTKQSKVNLLVLGIKSLDHGAIYRSLDRRLGGRYSKIFLPPTVVLVYVFVFPKLSLVTDELLYSIVGQMPCFLD